MNRHWIATLCLGLVLACLAVGGVRADERILDFHSRIAIAADGQLDVVETLRVSVDGRLIEHGIYRDFPTRYTDRLGNTVRIRFDLLDAQRDGAWEKSSVESLDNGLRIKLGNKDALVPVGEHTWTLHYRVNRELGFFPDHDELYWNVTGNGWIFPIDHASAQVKLPQAVDPANIEVLAFTGAQGERGTDASASVDGPGSASFATTAPLPEYSGLTIVVEFPKGVVAAPTAVQKLHWLLADNAGLLIGLLGLAVLWAYYLRVWNRVGRDPKPGVIIAEYEPPEGMTPAELRYIQKMAYDDRCFSADVVAMAVGGFLTIERKSHIIGRDEWTLSRPAQATNIPNDLAQRALGIGLLPSPGDSIELKNANASTIALARKAHEAALSAQCQDRYFVTNSRTLFPGCLLTAIVGALVLLVGVQGGMPLGIAMLALMIATNLLFVRLMKAQTTVGRKLLDHADGLKLYMSVADRDELHALQGPGASRPTLDSARYQALLPYALALGVEEAWTQQFTVAVGVAAAAAAAASATWYHGSGGMPSSFTDMSHAIGGSLDSAISSSSTPPGSSSGGGGGGFSGGGGGGGGGGGW